MRRTTLGRSTMLPSFSKIPSVMMNLLLAVGLRLYFLSSFLMPSRILSSPS